MRINATCGYDRALTRQYFSTWANHNIDTRLHIRIASFTNRCYATCLDTNISFDNAPMINNQRIGNHQICGFGTGSLALALPITDHLAAAKLHLIAVNR
jgi:hypothetical protein